MLKESTESQQGRTLGTGSQVLRDYICKAFLSFEAVNPNGCFAGSGVEQYIKTVHTLQKNTQGTYDIGAQGARNQFSSLLGRMYEAAFDSIDCIRERLI